MSQAFDLARDHRISREEASGLIRAHQAQAAPGTHKATAFNRSAFEHLLAQPGAAGTRIYHARPTDGSPTMVMVAVDQAGEDLNPETCRVIIAGSMKGVGKAIKLEMKRRLSIEPEIGHQKCDGKLGRNWLNSMLEGTPNAILCTAGHNLRKILARLRRLFVLSLGLDYHCTQTAVAFPCIRAGAA